jgi:hypothetical protein
MLIHSLLISILTYSIFSFQSLGAQENNIIEINPLWETYLDENFVDLTNSHFLKVKNSSTGHYDFFTTHNIKLENGFRDFFENNVRENNPLVMRQENLDQGHLNLFEREFPLSHDEIVNFAMPNLIRRLDSLDNILEGQVIEMNSEQSVGINEKKLTVNRHAPNEMLQQYLNFLNEENKEQLKYFPSISFIGEIGVDGGGLHYEFLGILSDFIKEKGFLTESELAKENNNKKIYFDLGRILSHARFSTRMNDIINPEDSAIEFKVSADPVFYQILFGENQSEKLFQILSRKIFELKYEEPSEENYFFLKKILNLLKNSPSSFLNDLSISKEESESESQLNLPSTLLNEILNDRILYQNHPQKEKLMEFAKGFFSMLQDMYKINELKDLYSPYQLKNIIEGPQLIDPSQFMSQIQYHFPSHLKISNSPYNTCAEEQDKDNQNEINKEIFQLLKLKKIIDKNLSELLKIKIVTSTEPINFQKEVQFHNSVDSWSDLTQDKLKKILRFISGSNQILRQPYHFYLTGSKFFSSTCSLSLYFPAENLKNNHSEISTEEIIGDFFNLILEISHHNLNFDAL